MKKIESEFKRLWESEHDGKQIPLAKKSESEKVAYEWFVRGASYMGEEISRILDGGGQE